MLIRTLNDELEILDQLVQTARNVAQVDDDLGLIGSDSLHQRVYAFIRLVQCINCGIGRLQKIVPVIRLAQLGANPQIRVVITPAGTAAKLAHAIEHIGNRHARAGNRRRCFGGESQVERRALGSGKVAGNLTQRAGTRPTQALKQHARLICRNHARPLATSLALDGMGLVDHPVTNRRQNPSLGGHIAEQQRMVGDHHVGMCRTTARPVDQAFIGEKRA